MAKSTKSGKASSALAPFSAEVPKDYESLTIRKIDNGYVVSRNGVKAGKHFASEKFQPRAPRISTGKNK